MSPFHWFRGWGGWALIWDNFCEGYSEGSDSAMRCSECCARTITLRGTISIPPHWTPHNNYHYSEHLGFLFRYKTLSAAQRQSQASYMRSQKAASPNTMLVYDRANGVLLRLKSEFTNQNSHFNESVSLYVYIINDIRFTCTSISYTHIGESVTTKANWDCLN